MNKRSYKGLFRLFLDYFKVGLFTFGGGLSMISLVEKTFVEKRKVITKDELLNMVAISESTPGIIAVNTATFIGYKLFGFLGSLLTTIAVCLPSFIIIIIISCFYDKFIDIEIIKYILSGIMVSVTYLLIRSGLKLYKDFDKSFIGILIIVISFIIMLLIKIFSINISTIFVILGGGIISLIYYILNKWRDLKWFLNYFMCSS